MWDNLAGPDVGLLATRCAYLLTQTWGISGIIQDARTRVRRVEGVFALAATPPHPRRFAIIAKYGATQMKLADGSGIIQFFYIGPLGWRFS